MEQNTHLLHGGDIKQLGVFVVFHMKGSLHVVYQLRLRDLKKGICFSQKVCFDRSLRK
jgi:hypothetical protein